MGKAKTTMGRLKNISTTAKVLLPIVAFVGLVGSAHIWLFATFATAGDIQQMRKEAQQESIAVKLLILEGRREQLVRERLTLESRPASGADRQRLGLLKDQIDRLDKQIDILLQLQTDLQKK